MIDPTEDATDFGRSPQEAMNLVAELVGDLATLNIKIEAAEGELKALKAQARTMEEDTIPSILGEAGLSAVVLSDGTKVSIDEIMTASITGKYKPVVMRWLRESGNDELIKTEVSVSFGKGHAQDAMALEVELARKGFSTSMDETVNTGSFKALIKELRKEGVSVPLEDLGVYLVKRANIHTQESE